jgi:AraC-like DNA-binding protein
MDVLLSEIDVGSELNPIRVSVGAVTYPPGGTLGARTQRDLQLVLVHAGSARVWVDDSPRGLTAGQVGLLLPAHRERFEFDRHVPTHHSWVQAHVPDLAAALKERLERLPKVLALSPALEALTREAVATAAGALPNSPALLGHLASAALWRYIGEAERSAPERSHPVDDATRFIHAHLHDPTLTLDQIARAAHVTPAHLIRSFRAEYGTTPKAYLWQRRVALGVDRLTNTGLALPTVAERCGFKTAHHFSRRIKQATGLPPAALRRAHWDGSITGLSRRERPAG